MSSRFLLISPARSGSTALRLAANVQPGVLCHGEILGRNRILGISNKDLPEAERAQLSPQMRQQDPERFLRIMLGQPGFDQQGFKALLPHFFLEQNAYLLSRVLATTSRVVFLWRRDLLRRFRSECLLRVEKTLMSPDQFAALTPADVLRDARHQIGMAAGVRAQLRGYGITRIMDLDFEDLIADPASTGRVLAFLDIDPARARLGKDKRTRQNEASAPPVPIPPVFDAPELADLRDVGLDQALNGDFDGLLAGSPG